MSLVEQWKLLLAEERDLPGHEAEWRKTSLYAASTQALLEGGAGRRELLEAFRSTDNEDLRTRLGGFFSLRTNRRRWTLPATVNGKAGYSVRAPSTVPIVAMVIVTVLDLIVEFMEPIDSVFSTEARAACGRVVVPHLCPLLECLDQTARQSHNPPAGRSDSRKGLQLPAIQVGKA